MSKRAIEWTGDDRDNWATGCDKVGPECKNCYMFPTSKRLQKMGQRKYVNGAKFTLHPEVLDQPLPNKPCRVFVNSMSDAFHKEVPLDFLQKAFARYVAAPQSHFQILTKRSDRLLELAPQLPWPDNIWMGVSIGLEKYLYRADHLRQTPAKVKFLSLEPLIGPLPNLHKHLEGIHWAIVGGESGPNARLVKDEWVRDAVQQCLDANVPVFFKQWGGVQKWRHGNTLDGKIYEGYPVYLPGELPNPIRPSTFGNWQAPRKTPLVQLEIAPKVDSGQVKSHLSTTTVVVDSGQSKSNVSTGTVTVDSGHNKSNLSTAKPLVQFMPHAKQKRPVAVCLNCQEEKEIVAHGLCDACRKADARAEALAEDTQASSKGRQKQIAEALKNHNAILAALHKQGVPQSVIDHIRAKIRPNFAVVDYLFSGLADDDDAY